MNLFSFYFNRSSYIVSIRSLISLHIFEIYRFLYFMNNGDSLISNASYYVIPLIFPLLSIIKALVSKLLGIIIPTIQRL